MKRFFENFVRSTRRDTRAKRRPLRIEHLEERRLLAMTLEVRHGSDQDDQYAYSLRQAIESANTAGGHDTIFIKDNAYDFDHKITLASNLPPITDGVTIYTQSGETVYIDCQYCENSRGLLIEITDEGDDDTVSLTNVGVANASGPAFELGGSSLENATLTECWVHGSQGNIGFCISASDATAITLTNCTTFRASTGILLNSSAHVDTLTIEGAQISAPDCTPAQPTWYGIRCEGTGNVVIQDWVQGETIRHTYIHDIPGAGIYLNGHATTALQAQIADCRIGLTPTEQSGPIAGNGIVVVDWSGTIDLVDLHTSYLLQNTIANCEFRGKPYRTWRAGRASQAA